MILINYFYEFTSIESIVDKLKIIRLKVSNRRDTKIIKYYCMFLLIKITKMIIKCDQNTQDNCVC